MPRVQSWDPIVGKFEFSQKIAMVEKVRSGFVYHTWVVAYLKIIICGFRVRKTAFFGVFGPYPPVVGDLGIWTYKLIKDFLLLHLFGLL